MGDVAAALDAIGAASRAHFGPSTSTKVVSGFTVVDGDPATLASLAGLPLDVYALARMVNSEEGSGSPGTLLALAETTRNKAARSGIGVFTLLTRSARTARAGLFGEQAGCWASTRLDPTARSVAAAQAALVEGTDLVGGAVDFFDPSTADRGVQLGRSTVPAETYIAQRAAEGLEWVGPVEGVDPYHLMLFGPVAGEVDTSGALAVLDAGRSGASGVFSAALAGVEASTDSTDATDSTGDDTGGDDTGAGRGLVIAAALVVVAGLLYLAHTGVTSHASV